MRGGKYKLLAHDMAIFGIGTIGAKLIIFLLLPIYTNALTKAEYGIADLVFSCSEILRPFISLAIYNGLQRYGLSKDYDKNDVFRCASVVFLTGAAISFLITPLFDHYDVISPWKWYLTVYALTVFASKNVLIYLKVSDQNKLYSLLGIVQAAILAICNTILLIVLDTGIKGYLIANIMAPIFITICGFFIGGAFRGLISSRFNKGLMREMVIYSMPFIVNDISWWLIHFSDKFLIEKMIGAEALGLYSAAAKIPLLVSVLASIFSQAWDLSVIRDYEQENDKAYYERIFKFFVVMVNGISVAIICVIKPFMGVYVGAGFQEAWKYVPLLLSATVFYTLDIFTVSFFAAMKKSYIIMWPTIIGGGINVVLNYVFIGQYGVWGAIIGTLGTYVFMMVVHYILLYKMMGFDLHVAFLTTNCLITLVMAFLVGIDFHVFPVAVVGVISFAILNMNEIKRVWSTAMGIYGVMMRK